MMGRSSSHRFPPREEQKDMKRTVSSQREVSGDRIKHLEGQLHKLKDSESKTLETLIRQTKQLAETKIDLENAKLQIRVLQDTLRSSRNPEKGNQMDYSSQHVQQIEWVRKELKLATAAEEKSKKAMDDLVAALKEVALDANQAKEKLLVVETQLLDKRSEAENTKKALINTEEKLGKVLEEVQSLKVEAVESATMWNIKNEGLKDCLRVLEDEIARGKIENNNLIQAQKASKDEISYMRDIMKHALNEAKMAKEALEIATNENSRLTDNPKSPWQIGREVLASPAGTQKFD